MFVSTLPRLSRIWEKSSKLQFSSQRCASSLSISSHSFKIKPTLEELLEDSDADVKFHADAGLQPKTEKMDCLTESAPKTEVKAF